MLSIGEQLKKFRKESRKTQQEFAYEIGISREFLSQVERNEKELSHGTALMIQEAIDAKSIPLSYRDRYFMGQNFANIIDVLRNEKPLSDLRDVLAVKGSDLSFMYIGLKPIPEKVKNILVKKYHVNWAYVLNGPRSSMFLKAERQKNTMSEVPYYKGVTIHDAVDEIVNNAATPRELIRLPHQGVDAYVDTFGNSMFPHFSGNEILGIALSSVNDIITDSLSIVQLKNTSILLGTLRNINKDNLLTLTFENKKYPTAEIRPDQVEHIFLCKVIITKNS